MSAKVDLLFPKTWRYAVWQEFFQYIQMDGEERSLGVERTIVLQDPPRSVIIVAEIIRPQECCCHAELQDQ